MRTILKRTLIVLGFGAVLGAVGPALAADKTNPDWPCVQKKIESLSVGQTWDGPPVETEKAPWADDDKINDLLQVLTSRKVLLPDAEAAIKKFADAQPAAVRDAKLTLLFAGLFETSNSQRKTVIGGLEKYLRSQRGRAQVVEQKGVVMAGLAWRLHLSPVAVTTLPGSFGHRTPRKLRTACAGPVGRSWRKKSAEFH